MNNGSRLSNGLLQYNARNSNLSNNSIINQRNNIEGLGRGTFTQKNKNAFKSQNYSKETVNHLFVKRNIFIGFVIIVFIGIFSIIIWQLFFTKNRKNNENENKS